MEVWQSNERLYRQLEVFVKLANEFWGGIIVPGCTVLVVALTVGSLYCTLRLHGTLHPLVYAFFPVVTVFLLTVIVIGVFGELAAVKRVAGVNLKYLAHKIVHRLDATVEEKMVRKYLQGRLRALRPFGVQCGPFGHIHLSTQAAMWEAIITYTLVLLTW